MALTGGITVSCADSQRRGGVKRAWITDVTNVDSMTAGSSHDFSAITVTTAMYKYGYEDFSFSVSSEGSKENGSSVLTHTIEFTIPKMTKEKAEKLQELVDLCKAVIVFEDFNDRYFVAGFDSIIEHKAGLTITVGQTIGSGLQDSNHFTISASGVSAELFREFTGSITSASEFEQ